MAYVVIKLLNEKLHFFIPAKNFYNNKKNKLFFMRLFNTTDEDEFMNSVTENKRKKPEVSLLMNIVILSSVILVNKLILSMYLPMYDNIYSLRIFLKKNT